MNPSPGVMLTPNLRLLRQIGEGGMGSVWLAEHAVLGTEVAVKLLSPELTTHPEALERFRREANAVAQLKSPHVVQIHDFGESDGTPFMVMERLEGEDLAARLARVHRLPIGIVTALVAQTCKALERVHELAIVHRDLKPGNIFLTVADGALTVKLLDFGVAKVHSNDAVHKTTDGSFLGTPLYMSPEQVLSTKDVSPASDLYSFAVVVYECLAGEPPFAADTIGAVHVKIAQGSFVPISERDRALPKTLDAWFDKALAPDPKKRWKSAREMADAFLVAARGGRSDVAEPITTSRARRVSTNHTALDPITHLGPKNIAIAGVLALVAAILAGWGTYRLIRPAPASSHLVPEPSAAISAALPAASASVPPPTLSALTPLPDPTAGADDPSASGSAKPRPRPVPGGGGGFRPPRKDRGF